MSRAAGEQLFYALTEGRGDWLGEMVFCAASRRLRARARWIGWREEQRRRRLPLIVNHCRFLLLPHKTFPNLGSRALRLTLDRLSADWQERYGHPVVLVETFVDPEQFSGTGYTANGWQELGSTDGFGRLRRDFHMQHNQPKRLFARELCRHARRSLAADQLKPARQASKPEPGRAAPTTPRKSMRVIGRFRRFSNSLFLHWRSRQKKPRHKTTTDFFTAMNLDSAVETAKYAKYANGQRVGKYPPFTFQVKGFCSGTQAFAPFFSRGSRGSRFAPTAVFRMNAEHHRYASRCLPARQPTFRSAS